MNATANQLQQMYVMYFNRPADTAGLAYWTDAAARGASLEGIAASFAASSEFTALYGGKPAAELVKAVYLNLFHRVAEPAGIAYWSGVIEKQGVSVHEAVAAIVRGAHHADQEFADNKVSAATAFTAALDAPARQTAYGNPTSLVLASTWLDGVTDNVSLVLAKIALPGVILEMVAAASGTLQGTLADGYIKGATVFADANENGKWDEGEAKTTTDGQGHFTLTGGIGTLVSSGGTDVATGSAVNGSFKAPAGSTMVSPLTTLVHSITSNGNIGAAQAETLVKATLGIADTIHLGSYDSIAAAIRKDASELDKAAALAVQSLAAQVNTLMGQVGAVLSGTGVTAGIDGGADAAAKALAELIVKAGGKLDLGLSSTAKQIVTDAAAGTGADGARLAQVDQLANDAGRVIANLNLAIGVASGKDGADAPTRLTEIAKVQVVAESVEKNMESGARRGDVSASVTATTGTALNQAINDATSQVGEIVPTAAPTEAPKTLTISVDSNKVLSFGGTAAGNIEVQLDADNVATFARGGVTAGVKPDLDNVAAISLAAGQVLNATAAQLSGRVVDGGGRLVVMGLDAKPDADLSGLAAASVQAAVNLAGGTLTLTGKLGRAVYALQGTGTVNVESATSAGATLMVDSGVGLEATASAVSGATLLGSGGAHVTGSAGEQTLTILNRGASMVSGGQGADTIKLGSGEGAQTLGFAFGGMKEVRSVDYLFDSDPMLSAFSRALLPGIAAKLSAGDTIRFSYEDKVFVVPLSGGVATLQNDINAVLGSARNPVVNTRLDGNYVVLTTAISLQLLADAVFSDNESLRTSDSPMAAYDAIENFQVGKDKVQLFDASGASLVAPVSLTRFADVDGGDVGSSRQLLETVLTSAAFQGLSAMQAGVIVVTSGDFAGAYLYVHRPQPGSQDTAHDVFIKLVNPVGLGAAGVLNVADYFSILPDHIAPVAKILYQLYEESNRTLTFFGTKFSTMLNPGEDPGKDVKAYLDWSKLAWDIDGNGIGAGDVAFALSDIDSAHIVGQTLSVALIADKHASLVTATGYGAAGSGMDSIIVKAGFIRDGAGNAASGDAIEGALTTSRYVELQDGVTLAPVVSADWLTLSAAQLSADYHIVDMAGVAGSNVGILDLARNKTLTLINADHLATVGNAIQPREEVYREIQGNLIVSSSSITFFTGGAGDDQFTATGNQDALFAPGAGANVLTGGTGQNTYLIDESRGPEANSIAALIANTNTVNNWKAAAANNLGWYGPVIARLDAPVQGHARISKEGLATFDAADATLTQKLEAVVAVVGTGSDFWRTSVVFNHGNDTYLFGLRHAGSDEGRYAALVKVTEVTTTGMVWDFRGSVVGLNPVVGDASPPPPPAGAINVNEETARALFIGHLDQFDGGYANGAEAGAHLFTYADAGACIVPSASDPIAPQVSFEYGYVTGF